MWINVFENIGFNAFMTTIQTLNRIPSETMKQLGVMPTEDDINDIELMGLCWWTHMPYDNVLIYIHHVAS